MALSATRTDAGPLQSEPARVTRASVRDDVVLGAATVATGLLAGLFYGYACSVMPGLRAAGDRTAVEAMQEINKAIQNPVFFATFMGAPALGIWALVIERRRGSPVAMRWVAAGVCLCVLGVFVTFAFNIPLNDRLENAGDPSQIADIARVRDDFETPWTIWNVVRTLLIAAALGCLTRASFLRARLRRAA